MKTTLRKLTVAWPLVIFLLLPALTRAETAVQAWVQLYNGPGERGRRLRRGGGWQQQRDRDGVFVSAAEAVSITRRSSIRARACRSGPTATTGRATAMTDAYAVAVDGSNNVIVTGYSYGSGSD